MKVAWLFLVVIVVVCLTYESEAWRLRRLRIVRLNFKMVKYIGCRWYCPRVCKGKSGDCKFVCKKACRRGKREAIANIQEGHVAPMPDSFASYDTINVDGLISIEEMAREVNEEPTAPDFIEAFQAADANGDDKLSKEEFYDGPFVLEMDVDEDKESKPYMRQKMLKDDDLEDLEEADETDPEWTGEGIDKGDAADGAEEQTPIASPTNSTRTKFNAQTVV